METLPQLVRTAIRRRMCRMKLRLPSCSRAPPYPTARAYKPLEGRGCGFESRQADLLHPACSSTAERFHSSRDSYGSSGIAERNSFAPYGESLQTLWIRRLKVRVLPPARA